MKKIHEKRWTVLENECDVSRRIRLARLMQHAQQMGSDHLGVIGVDYRKMYEDGMVFIVNKMKISIKRRPEFGEPLTIITIPKEPKGIQFIRDTLFCRDGQILVEVSISWALIEPQSRKILRPKAFDRYGFEFSPNDGEQITGYKIHRPAGKDTFHQRQIHYSDLDYNGHVNNTVYADIVCDLLPLETMKEKEIQKFGIIYHKETRHNEVLALEVVQDHVDHYYFAAKSNNKACFSAEINFA